MVLVANPSRWIEAFIKLNHVKTKSAQTFLLITQFPALEVSQLQKSNYYSLAILLLIMQFFGFLIHWEILTYGCDRSSRSWKPNVQEKRLFSYILDRHIQVKVTTHALRCIDKAGGIDEYLLKTPYHKMDTEMGLFWKAKIEKMYEELGQKEVVFFSPEDEAKFEQGFKDLKLAERAVRRDARRQMYGGSGKQEKLEDGRTNQGTKGEGNSVGEDSSHGNVHEHEQLVANS